MRTPTRVKLPRTWCLYPVVRDTNLKVHWRKGAKHSGSRFWCHVPGHEAKVYWLDREQIPARKLNRLRRYGERIEPRLPTGICSNVLMAVLALAQRFETHTIEFDSLEALITCSVGAKNRGPFGYYAHAINHAIRLWQVTHIAWPRLELGPPFSEVVLGDRVLRNGQRSILITVAPEWLRACEHNGVLVRLRLPTRPWTHNIILSTLATGSTRVHANEFGYRMSGNQKCQESTPLVPTSIWLRVKEWYEAHSGMIDYKRDLYTFNPKLGKLCPSRMVTIEVIKP